MHRPVKALRAGTERLARGDLGYQIGIRSHDELGELAASFNRMSRELQETRAEVTAWTRTLEDRVEQKTHELTTAHEQMLQAEKMASLGKLAAVVAHEINNPLSGILTYAKLLRRWTERRRMPRPVSVTCWGGTLARSWMEDAATRMHRHVPAALGAVAQDGGVALADLTSHMPDADWTRLAREFFLS